METSNSETDQPTEPTEIEIAIVRGETSGVLRIENNIAKLSEDTSFDQWKEGLRFIKWVRKRAAIAVCDYIDFGVKKWGREMIDHALEQLELEATLVKAAIAINAIPQDLRFDNLDGDHFVELSKADLPRKDIVRWARIASEQGLTPMQLRFSIIEGEVVDRAAAKQQGTGVYTVHGIRQSFDIWVRRVGGLAGVLQMDIDHQTEIMEELQAICEFGLQLNHHIMLHKNTEEVAHATQPDPA